MNLNSDINIALKWFRKAAKNKHGFALSLMDYIRNNGVKAEYDLSHIKEWLFERATQGDVKAQEALSTSYHYGLVTPRDADKGKEWYKKAEKLRRKHFVIENEDHINVDMLRPDTPAYIKAILLHGLND